MKRGTAGIRRGAPGGRRRNRRASLRRYGSIRPPVVGDASFRSALGSAQGVFISAPGTVTNQSFVPSETFALEP